MLRVWVFLVCADTEPKSSSLPVLFCLQPVACLLRRRPAATPLFYWTTFAALRASPALRLPRQQTIASQNGTGFWTEAIASTSGALDRCAAATIHGFLRPALRLTFWLLLMVFPFFEWIYFRLLTRLLQSILTQQLPVFGLGTQRPSLPAPLVLQPSAEARTTFAA